MSTVLDALRKLQREREVQRVPWELGSSASDLVAFGPTRRRRPWRWLVGVCVVAGGLATAAGAGLLPLPNALSGEVRLALDAPALPSDEEPFAETALSLRRRLTADSAVGGVPAPAVHSPPLAAAPEEPGPADVGAARASLPARVRKTPVAAGVQNAPVPQAPAARDTPQGSLQVGPPQAPLRVDTAARGTASAARRWDARLAQVRVDRIRWHPDPERRVAYLHLPERSELPAHEGDVVDGMLVLRIDPEAVELGVGSATRRARLGP